MSMIDIDFLIHSEVVVAATPAAIWPYIIETNRWHGSQTMIPAGGPPGEVGERFHAVHSDFPDMVAFHIENVELATHRRRTIRLDTPEGRYLGYATWVLGEGTTGTTVAYHVYCRYSAPVDAVRDGLLVQAQRQMDDGLERLKGLIEADATAT